MTLDLAEAAEELRRLSKLIDSGVDVLRKQGFVLAEAEQAYRVAQAEAWVRCPNDAPEVRAGEREWTAARREAWVAADTAPLRKARDEAETLRDTARIALRARQSQMSALQTLITAHRAEAEFVRTSPEGMAA